MLFTLAQRLFVVSTPASWDQHWRDLLDQNRAAEPGLVALMLFPQGLSDIAVDSLQHVLSSLVGLSGIKPYGELFSVVPRIGDGEKEVTTSSPQRQHSIVAADLEALTKYLREIPDRSIVVVHNLEIIHAAGAAQRSEVIRTWSGAEVAMETFDERYGAAVGIAVERLLHMAQKRNLLIVAHANLSSRAADFFDIRVRSAPQLCISGGERIQDRYGALLSRLLGRVRAGSLSLAAARSRARRATKEPELAAQAEAQLLFAQNRFDEAWLTLQPHLASYGNAPAAICSGVARFALAAFRHDDARDWLQRAVEAGPRSFADLNSAWQLARELDNEVLSEVLFKTLAAAFPAEPILIQEQANRSLRDWKYEEAAAHARRAGLHFHAAVWEQLARAEFDLEGTLRLARHDEDRAYIHWRAALDAENRGDLDSAALLAARVPEGSAYSGRAIAFRLRIFGRGLLHQKEVGDPDVDELMPLLSATAVAPQEARSRMAFEDLMEETIGERLALTLLVGACEQLLPSLLYGGQTAPRALLFSLHEGDLADSDEAVAFSRELSQSGLTDLLMIGRGELPPALLPRATPELVRALLFVNQLIDLTGNSRLIVTHRLWEMELICRAIGDPSKDCLAAIQLVRALARMGDGQVARDFAEDALRALPTTQPMHRPWRSGLGWMVFAEAFLWTGNPMSALRCATLMLAAWQSTVREAEVACDALNLLARIYRDLGLTPLARRCLEHERRLRTTSGSTQLIWQLDAMVLDLNAQELRGRDRTAWLRHFAKLLHVWRELPERAERLPMLSRVVSIARHLQILGATLPKVLIDELTKALKAEKGPLAKALLHAISRSPTRLEFLAIVESLDSAVRTDDLKTQLSKLRMLAEDTIGAAVCLGDPRLFLTAFAVVAQPVLSLAARKVEDPMQSDVTELHRHAIKAMSSLDSGAIRDMDAILRRAGRPREMQILPACEVTPAQLVASLRLDETAMLIAHSGAGRLAVCAVDRIGSSWLWLAPEQSWSESRFAKWRRQFPSAYGSAPKNGAARWTREMLLQSLDGLGLYLPFEAGRLIIIPSAELFLFPFSIASRWRQSKDISSSSFLTPAAAERFLGEDCAISVVPSPQWLIRARAASEPSCGERRVWMGAPETRDSALLDLREALRWNLEAHQVQQVHADRPTAMAGCSLAILIAHGVQADGGEFHALADGKNRFTPTEVASWVDGCSCVVIAACHGGAATAPSLSHETRGLTSAILSGGVRAVVACPWPLSTRVIQLWMPRFLQSISAGETVEDAALVAAREVQRNEPDAAAGFSMQVFGDGSVRMPSNLVDAM